MDKTSLGTRMKQYEQSVGPVLVQRMPVIVRIDGKAFHSWTKCLPKTDGPSHIMHDMMLDTSLTLCNEIQNAVFAYTQSDEISILLRDYDTVDTQQWFGGVVQKIISVSSSIATYSFNMNVLIHGTQLKADSNSKPALFDARVFNVPKEDVANYFVWRQQDATRNSINYIARQHFSHKQLHGKNKSDVQEMLFQEKGINWNDYETWKKRGMCVERIDQTFYTDDEIPIFTQNRNYIEKHVYVDGGE